MNTNEIVNIETFNRPYDLIFSLGGSCATAHNLDIRNLRKVSLPFDWTFMHDMSPINALTQCFQDDFKHFLLKENLYELCEEERGSQHGDYKQYKDSYTGYCWVNHFLESIRNEEEYERVKNIIDKRVVRLYTNLMQSKSALLILNNRNFAIFSKPIHKLDIVLKSIFPHCEFQYILVEFAAQEEKISIDGRVSHIKYLRNLVLDDYHTTTPEWDFLNNISLSI